jgi:hypothetical protein
LDGVELQLVVLVEVLQEPLVDRVQIDDEKVVRCLCCPMCQQMLPRSLRQLRRSKNSLP